VLERVKRLLEDLERRGKEGGEEENVKMDET
jgi:hypothetical protein